MTGETIRDLLMPLIGKPGSISMVVTRIGQVRFATAENLHHDSGSCSARGLWWRRCRCSGYTGFDSAEPA
jgi:hypothetical protein